MCIINFQISIYHHVIVFHSRYKTPLCSFAFVISSIPFRMDVILSCVSRQRKRRLSLLESEEVSLISRRLFNYTDPSGSVKLGALVIFNSA